MTKQNHRLTPHRAAVLETLRATPSHPTAAELFRLVRRRRPNVAYATIYNALNWLKRNGMIGSITFGDDATRYDPIIERHDHLVCMKCGELTDIRFKLPQRSWLLAGRGHRFQVRQYRVELLGHCNGCAAETNGSS